jgi:hypothetical protein
VREFAKLGLTRSVGGVLALALARELTPVVTAIILAGRVGSAFAAELGTMQVGVCVCGRGGGAGRGLDGLVCMGGGGGGAGGGPE